MKNIIEADPFRCRMWDLHDRIDARAAESTCKQMLDSILSHGQLVPALGRRLTGDRSFDIELIYGARRLFVARQLNRPLLVELRAIDDTEAIIAMDIENRHRQDISPFERGASYLRWLRGGYFKSQDDIARTLKISSSQVSRLLKLAHLPAAVVGAFEKPSDICENWGLDLSEILENPQDRAATCARARAIAQLATRPPAREIYQQLLSAAAPGKKIKPRRRDEVVTGRDGKPLFRICKRSMSVALLLPMSRISEGAMDKVRTAVSNILENPLAPAREASVRRPAQPPASCAPEP
jgi:ParB family chromosome partitioning protein